MIGIKFQFHIPLFFFSAGNTIIIARQPSRIHMGLKHLNAAHAYNKEKVIVRWCGCYITIFVMVFVHL